MKGVGLRAGKVVTVKDAIKGKIRVKVEEIWEGEGLRVVKSVEGQG